MAIITFVYVTIVYKDSSPRTLRFNSLKAACKWVAEYGITDCECTIHGAERIAQCTQ
jgi:hypothetical protein